MIAELKPYRATTESGVPWLQRVPAHWNVRRLKWDCLLNPSRVEAQPALHASTIVTFLPMDRVGTDGRVDATVRTQASNVWTGFTYFRRGDVLVAKITPCFENGKGACLDALPTEVGFGSTEFHVLRARSTVLPRFVYRLTSLPEFRRLGADAMTGAAGQQRVPEAFVAGFPVSLPPLPEQAAIVRFLDYADRRIRRYVRAKQKLIKLLEEQKQAIIHHAVTRGLDPSVRLKPSGVEWLGDVPAHWEVRTLGRIATSFRTGPFGSALHQSDYIEGGIPLVNPTHMHQGNILEDSACSVSTSVAERLASYSLERHDLVFSRRGELGRCALVRHREVGWLCGTGSIRVRVERGSAEPEYLIAALQVRWVGEFLSLASVGATMDSLNTGILKQLPLLLPPPGEQRQIHARIADRSERITSTAAKAHREIALLREYRTRLIADVVTGKLDVREAAAGLPDEPEEVEQLDDADASGDSDAVADEDAASVPEEAET